MSKSQTVRATAYAFRVHEMQTRKSHSERPYIGHPIQVARLLDAAGCIDDNIIVAGIFHGLLGKRVTRPSSIEDIREYFGEKVANLVTELNRHKENNYSKLRRKALQWEESISISEGSFCIKIAHHTEKLTEWINDTPKGLVLDCGYVAWMRTTCTRTVFYTT
jgi:(p)ppGpp synthase/HD superfamily hydrolase